MQIFDLILRLFGIIPIN